MYIHKQLKKPNTDTARTKVCQCYQLLLNDSAFIAGWDNVLFLIQPVIYHYVINVSAPCVL